MRIVACEAVAHGRRMNRTFDLCRVFIGMAGEAEFVRRGRDQLDTGHVAIHAHFVTAKTTRGDCRMNRFPLRLFFVTLNTCR